MSSANISSGPANCMKFNSSFLYYIAFFVLLVIGYMWGKRNGTKEERKKDARSDAKKAVVVGAAVAPKPSKGSKKSSPAKGKKSKVGSKRKKGSKRK
jgi:hypothetical protein